MKLLPAGYRCFFLLLACLWQCCHAQELRKDTLYLQKVNDEDLTEYFTYFNEPEGRPLTAAAVDSCYRLGQFRWWAWHVTLSPGHISTAFWLRLTAKNTLPLQATFLWSVYNLVDSLWLYKKSPRGFIVLDSLSQHTPPSKRLFNRRNLSLPFTLRGGESAVLYLKLTNPDGQLYAPNDITTVEDYLAYESRYLIVSNWYFLFGFFLFAFVFNLILYFFLKDAVHIWYAAYAASTLLFLMMEDSLTALLFPDFIYFFLLQVGQYSFLLLSAAFGIGILLTFIKQRQKSLLSRAGQWIIGGDLAFVFLYACLYHTLESNRLFGACRTLNFIRDAALGVSVAFTLYTLIGALVKKNRLSYYYAGAYFFFLVGSGIFFFNYHGITHIHFVEPNELGIGLFMELMLLLLFITLRFQLLLKENTNMKIEELERQKKTAALLILAQDEERQRLARDLHDDLGGTVGRIRLLLSRMQDHEQRNGQFLAEMQALVKKAAADVRNISHELMPVDLQQKGLFQAMQDLSAFLSEHSGVVYRFFSNGDGQSVPHELQLVIYRIFNELTSNIVKHAAASHAELQCIIYEDQVLITAEDNGKGMAPGSMVDGIGLKNIQNRVEYLHGKMNIDSSPAGTTVIIEIPLVNGK